MKIPPKAQQEIMEILGTNKKIHADDIAKILKAHHVCADAEALQTSYRKRLGQRYLPAIRDGDGKREVFAAGNEYIIVECCNDPKQLKQIQHKLPSNVSGLNASTKKVRGRILFLQQWKTWGGQRA